MNTFGFYSLGKRLAPLISAIENDYKLSEVNLILVLARLEVQAVLYNDRFYLKTSRQAGNALIEEINKVLPANGEEFRLDRIDNIITASQTRTVKNAAIKFETVLAEELGVFDTYCIGQIGAYSTSELLDDLTNTLPETIRDKLTANSKVDIREAGRCLVLQCPTAAGFHILRALESVLVVYVKQLIGNAKCSKNWGAYIKKMQDSGNADEKIIGMIEHIKNNYRNPVSHPEVILDMEEVLVTFGLALSAIYLLAKKIN